jgi:CPA1 family monovalent cation:H+ antiporter
MAQPGIPVDVLIDILDVFIIAAAVGILIAKLGRFPYTIALLIAGFVASVVGYSVEFELSHDLILIVLLPPLLFEGAATTEFERLRRNIVPILTLAIVGLVIAIAGLGVVGSYLFPGFPLLISLLFATMILPTDPVSVLALFEELGAPDRLAVLVEGESLVNDGVGVVIFSALLGYVGTGEEAATATEQLFTVAGVGGIATEVALFSVGGLLVGLAAGALAYSVMVNLDEHMTEVVLTIILAYGAFLLAEHYLHVSGVIATVVAGLFIGNRGAEYAMSPRTKLSIFTTWETAAFIVNTFIFLMIGVTTPIGDLIDNAHLIASAIVLVLVARAAVVYPLTALANRFTEPEVPLDYQHVMVWGGLHASIPIALVLGLPPGTPFRSELRAMVFGVAAFSLVVQGLTMSRLLDHLDVVTRSEAEELYEVLVGRLRAVDGALDAAESLRSRGDVPSEVYGEFSAEYEREMDDLQRAISTLLVEHPELHRQQLLTGERRVLRRERAAVRDALRSGAISDDVSERLLDEIALKLDYVADGLSTVATDEEAYEEFWRDRVDEYGMDLRDARSEAEAEEE